MLEFVERRRQEHAQARHERIQLVAIIALGLIGIGLTAVNTILVNRLVARPLPAPGATGRRPSARRALAPAANHTRPRGRGSSMSHRRVNARPAHGSAKIPGHG